MTLTSDDGTYKKVSGVSPMDLTIHVSDDLHGRRLDTAMTQLLPTYSRNFFQHAIKEGLVMVNGVQIKRASQPVKALDAIHMTLPPKRLILAETVINTIHDRNISLEVIYQHEHFLILYKPADIMVHAPSERSTAVTVVDWLLVNFPDIASVGFSDRPGIVHRIDRDTSGLLIVPTSPYAHKVFSDIFKNRQVRKLYHAIVEGHMPRSGTIDIPIGRALQGNKMQAFPGANPVTQRSPKIRHAITHYRALEYFVDYTLIEVTIVTGRTHQIRVHCAAQGHAVVGDPIYGNKSKHIKRQALHAYSLAFSFDGHDYAFTSPLPQDMASFLEYLRMHNALPLDAHDSYSAPCLPTITAMGEEAIIADSASNIESIDEVFDTDLSE